MQGEKIDGDQLAIKLQFVFSYPLLISFVPYFGGRFSRGGDGDFALLSIYVLINAARSHSSFFCVSILRHTIQRTIPFSQQKIFHKERYLKLQRGVSVSTSVQHYCKLIAIVVSYCYLSDKCKRRTSGASSLNVKRERGRMGRECRLR